jgi:hypothetical protein
MVIQNKNKEKSRKVVVVSLIHAKLFNNVEHCSTM